MGYTFCRKRRQDLKHATEENEVVAEIVGHSDIRLTQNVYQHVYREAKRTPPRR
jgi:integrase